MTGDYDEDVHTKSKQPVSTIKQETEQKAVDDMEHQVQEAWKLQKALQQQQEEELKSEIKELGRTFGHEDNRLESQDERRLSPFDLTEYTNLEPNECRQSKILQCPDDKILSCVHLKRISVGLQYYDLHCKNKIERQDFIQFCQEICCNCKFLDDYDHFISIHKQDIDQIKEELRLKYGLEQCEVGVCEVIGRHYRSHADEMQNDPDAVYAHCMDCFDRLHHYIWHVEEMGLRINKSQNEIKEDSDEQMVELTIRLKE